MVWVLNAAVSPVMICNTSEETAQRLAETHVSHIYFFADLVAPLEG